MILLIAYRQYPESISAPSPFAFLLSVTRFLKGIILSLTGQARARSRFALHALFLLIHEVPASMPKSFLVPVYRQSPKPVHAMSLWVLNQNLRAISFYQKNGFRSDGTVRPSGIGDALKSRYICLLDAGNHDQLRKNQH